MAIAAIILLMPLMTELTELLLLLAAATFVGAWIGSGNARIAYAGLQVGFAFFLITLQGYGPVTDMETAKNRVIGILLGLAVSYAVLAHLWPVRVDRLAATSLGDAADALGKLLRRLAAPDTVREAFATAITKARTQLEDGLFEGTPPGRVGINEYLVDQVEALVIPVSIWPQRTDGSSRTRLPPGSGRSPASSGPGRAARCLSAAAARPRLGRASAHLRHAAAPADGAPAPPGPAARCRLSAWVCPRI